ncbi:putative outer membrane receptor protein, partial [Vibrio parahaemolyticus VPTS-2010_2]
MEVSKHAA